MMRQRDFDLFADLLTYPAPGSGRELPLPPGEGQAAELGRFLDEIRPLSCEELEELYTRTFDINPVSSLEVGWHLYGEQYERGAFLVKMRELLRAHGVPESTELPDHLTHVLRLLGRMTHGEAQEFSTQYLLPAVAKMLHGFAETSNPYSHLLAALAGALEHEYRSTSGVTTHG